MSLCWCAGVVPQTGNALVRGFGSADAARWTPYRTPAARPCRRARVWRCVQEQEQKEAAPEADGKGRSAAPVAGETKAKANGNGRAASDTDGKPAAGIRTLERDVTKKIAVPEPIQFEAPRSSTLEMIRYRTVDTINDVVLHYSRKFKRNETLAKLAQATKPVVCVLGFGWGGHAFVKTIDTDKYDVVVISPRNHFLFTPMLASTAVGTVEFRSILEPVRVSNEFVTYFEATCENIDQENQVLLCKNLRGNTFEQHYDYLVLGVGAPTNTFNTPGVEEYAHFMKEVSDAKEIRKGIIDQFEAANLPNVSAEERERLLTFAVVGGGPTGCEFSAELSDFLRSDLKKYYPRLMVDTKVKLLNSGSSILLQFDEALQAKALDNFRKTQIDVVTDARVVAMDDTTITLKNGSKIPYGLCVWAAGIGTNPLVSSLIARVPQQKDAKGRLVIDEWQRVKGMNNTFAFGDCAVAEKRPLPATGQVAAQQGSYVSRLLNKNVCLACEVPVILPRELNNTISGQALESLREKGQAFKNARPFEFLSLGILAYVGDSKAIADVEAGDLKLGGASGTLAFLLWRSVYLTKQVSFRNRVLVLFDWLRSQIFGRDTSQMGLIPFALFLALEMTEKASL
ncbi:putative NADH dehydrogenase [Porphyridium purpureum]|uniref:Putative NADH dehydrogenase n=1 Tax=Porphyridium purpureum TaxID=35688 RepID=A0A5J4YSR7_PORPP|nr:putative NADH dehydrogenase [Porphyridium purpureum]|eukprot:POR3074..scf229_5